MFMIQSENLEKQRDENVSLGLNLGHCYWRHSSSNNRGSCKPVGLHPYFSQATNLTVHRNTYQATALSSHLSLM